MAIVILAACEPAAGSSPAATRLVGSAVTVADQLAKAAARGDTASVLELLDDGADVDERDDGWSDAGDDGHPRQPRGHGAGAHRRPAPTSISATIAWTTRSCTPAPKACWTSCG